MGIFSSFWSYLRSWFWTTEMELTLIGLQNSGKTTLLTVLSGGEFTEDTIPTVGFNMRKVSKGSVTLKCWDLGGQPRFRSMWERYCRGVSSIVFILDASDPSKIPTSRTELHSLLALPTLTSIPLLVLANKNDLRGVEGHEVMSVDDVIEQMELGRVEGRECSCYAVSAKTGENLDAVMGWLVARAKNAKR
ncbi:hypothetical protein YB2330_006154 [Saitoella coloradoensis]